MWLSLKWWMYCQYLTCHITEKIPLTRATDWALACMTGNCTQWTTGISCCTYIFYLFCVSLTLYPCASLSNDTSCRVILLSPHKMALMVISLEMKHIMHMQLDTFSYSLFLFTCHPVWTEANTSICRAVCRICPPPIVVFSNIKAEKQ